MKYVPGPSHGQFSGSQGNTTASHNRFGSYLRNRTIPVNPNTAHQQLSRELTGQLASDYRDLTPAQRVGWAALGEQIVRLDGLGQPYTLTGIQAFVMVNRFRLGAGQTVILDAPVLNTESNLLSLSLTATNVLGVVTVNSEYHLS